MNRRPLFYAALFFMVGISIDIIFPANRFFLLASVFLFILLAFLSSKSSRGVLLCIAVVMTLCGAARLAFFNTLSPNDISVYAARLPDKTYVDGMIVSLIDQKTFYGKLRASFILQTDKIVIAPNNADQSHKTQGLVRVFLKDGGESLRYGDTISLEGELLPVRGATNPGSFEKKAYWDRRGVRCVLYAEKSYKIIKRGSGNFFCDKAGLFRDFLCQKLAADFIPRDAAFLQALFFGERSGLGDDFKDLFLKTGTMHILAVSGFNIGFLLATLGFLLAPFGLPKNIFRILMLFAVWGYCLLVGWQAPVVRAAVMASVLITAGLLGRRADILNSLGFAALVILGINPKELTDVGFQLSFLAVWALAVFTPVFIPRLVLFPNEKQTIKEKFMRYFEELFWVSFICLLVTLPVTAQTFYIAAPLSILANLAVVPLSFLLFFAGIVYFLTFWWIPTILVLVTLPVKCMMQVFVGSLFFVENLPGAYFIVGRLNSFLWAALILGLAYLALDRRITRRYARAALMTIFSLNIFLAQDMLRQWNRPFSLTVLDLGQGDSNYLEFPGGANLLIDAGKGGDSDKGRWVIAPFLKSRGIHSITALFLTHSHDDHIGGAGTILEEFKVKNIITPSRFLATRTGRDIEQKIEQKKITRWFGQQGQQIEGFPGTEISILSPSEDLLNRRKANLESLVLKITHRGVSFLLTGDLQDKAMRSILESGANLKADVLEVPHHGLELGKNWPLFLERVNPNYIILSRGPKTSLTKTSKKTLDALASFPKNRIFDTDRDGAITISIDKSNTLNISTFCL